MRKEIDDLWRLIEPPIQGAGLELVELQWNREPEGWVLRVFIDRPEGPKLPGSGESDAHVNAVDFTPGTRAFAAGPRACPAALRLATSRRPLRVVYFLSWKTFGCWKKPSTRHPFGEVAAWRLPAGRQT